MSLFVKLFFADMKNVYPFNSTSKNKINKHKIEIKINMISKHINPTNFTLHPLILSFLKKQYYSLAPTY